MFRACTLATIVAAALAAAACGTDRAPTGPEARPSFRSQKHPSGPGAQVFHDHGQFFATFRQPGSPFILIGASASAVRVFCRGGDPDFAPFKELFVEGPNGIHSTFKSDGKVPLLVYRPGTEDLCDGSPIAQGTGLYTDNTSNLVGGHGRGNASSRVRGQVTNLAGERQHVLVSFHEQLGPTGFEDVVVKISVK